MNQIPIVGQQQAQAKAAIQQAMQQLSVSIYSQLAVQHIGTRDVAASQEVDPARLQQLAIDSHAAALAYFKGIGVITSSPPNDKAH